MLQQPASALASTRENPLFESDHRGSPGVLQLPRRTFEFPTQTPKGFQAEPQIPTASAATGMTPEEIRAFDGILEELGQLDGEIGGWVEV